MARRTWLWCASMRPAVWCVAEMPPAIQCGKSFLARNSSAMARTLLRACPSSCIRFNSETPFSVHRSVGSRTSATVLPCRSKATHFTAPVLKSQPVMMLSGSTARGGSAMEILEIWGGFGVREPSPGRGVRGETSPMAPARMLPRQHHLQRHQPIQLRVAGEIDDAHAAAPQLADDFVPGHLRPPNGLGTDPVGRGRQGLAVCTDWKYHATARPADALAIGTTRAKVRRRVEGADDEFPLVPVVPF